MKIYQAWDGEDMANSDTWWPTLKEAVAHIRERYGVTGPIKLDAAGDWEGEADSGFDVHISRSELKPTREEICNALTFWPNR